MSDNIIRDKEAKEKIVKEYKSWLLNEADSGLDRMVDYRDDSEAYANTRKTLEDDNEPEYLLELIDEAIEEYGENDKDSIVVEWSSVLNAKIRELDTATLERHFPIPKMYEKFLEELFDDFLMKLGKWEGEEQIADQRMSYLKPFLEKKAHSKNNQHTPI